MKTLLVSTIKEVNKLSIEDIEHISKLIQNVLEEYIKLNSNLLNLKIDFPIRKIQIGPLKEEYRVDVGTKRTKDTLIIADWVLQLQPTTKTYLLYFLIIKEGLLHFLRNKFGEVEEAIINIIAILWLVDQFKVKTYDSPLMAAIGSRIYSEFIGGIAYQQFNSFLSLLFIKKIPFSEVFLKNFNLLIDDNKTGLEKTKEFGDWVNSLIKDEDIIAPIIIKSKLFPILNDIVKLGYDKSSSSNISKNLELHENTVRNYMQDLTSTFTIIWRPILNYEKLKLHNYFLKIEAKEKKVFDQISKLVWDNIPYNKTLYIGESETTNLIYCPSLICPHIVSETLNDKLKKLEKEGTIENYNLQLIKEKKIYSTITSKITDISIKTFNELLQQKQNKNIKKFIFSHEKREFAMEFDDKKITLDYNLLYFLSILRGKPLLKSRYNVITSKLTEFYEKNNIPITEVKNQTDFLNQIEYRARKRKILSYSLYMRSLSPLNSNIFIFEIPTLNYDENKISKIIQNLRVFSFLGEFTITDRLVFMIPGISHKHIIRKIIEEKITVENLKMNYYTISLNKSRFVPLHNLYDYDNQKWK